MFCHVGHEDNKLTYCLTNMASSVQCNNDVATLVSPVLTMFLMMPWPADKFKGIL